MRYKLMLFVLQVVVAGLTALMSHDASMSAKRIEQRVAAGCGEAHYAALVENNDDGLVRRGVLRHHEQRKEDVDKR